MGSMRSNRVWTQEEWEKFIQRWQAASNVAEVADAYAVSKQHIYNRAASARNKGVPLKYMRTVKPDDYAALAKFAEELNE